MASAGDDFYAGVARAGYRGAYLREIARRVAAKIEESLAAREAAAPRIVIS
jgi:hypothetical protein